MGDVDDLIGEFQQQAQRWRQRKLGGLEKAKLEGQQDRNVSAERLLAEIAVIVHQRLIFVNTQQRDWIKMLHDRGIRTAQERQWVEDFHRENKIIDFFWKRP